jgi:hydrogenase nickel incorporation protein HypA/HybF
MHELSLARNVLDMVEAAAQRDGFDRVGQLRLEVGALAGVEVDALRFALECIVPGTCLAQAEICIDTPSGTAWCAACAQTVAITTYLDLCPMCSGTLTRQTGGDQLRVVDLLVHDD